MLAATIEAAADLDVQVFCTASSNWKLFSPSCSAQFRGESARRRNSELAGIGSGASDDIDDGARAGVRQASGFERLVEFRQIALAHPANHEVLFDRGAHGFFGEAANDVRQRAQLVGGNVAQRKRDGHRHVAGLLLRASVGLRANA